MDNQKRPFTTRFDHYNYNVLNLERSLAFYDRAFGFREVKRKEAADGSFILVYLGDVYGHFLLELTWLRDRKEPYNLGENEVHLCVRTTGMCEILSQIGGNAFGTTLSVHCCRDDAACIACSFSTGKKSSEQRVFARG